MIIIIIIIDAIDNNVSLQFNESMNEENCQTINNGLTVFIIHSFYFVRNGYC